MTKVTSIDIGAISFLLAKINEIRIKKKNRFWGRIPNDPKCKKIIEESGFLQYMTDIFGNEFKRKSDNFIFKLGTGKTRNKQVGEAIEKSLNFITGKTEKYPPVYSIVQEICSNSVEWANPESKKNKNWFLGLNNNKSLFSNSITFTMTDIGYGILNTLNKKFITQIKESFLTKDTDILLRAFDRKYGSKTLEINRNRGLPLIKNRFHKGFIKNLIVITNNAYLDFNNHENSRTLKKNLHGTFYSWEIDKDCIKKWKRK